MPAESGELEYLGNDPDRLNPFLDRLDEEGKQWRDQWGGQLWDTNVKIVRGDIWPDKTTTPMFASNIISPAIRRKSGLLVESKPTLDIRPRRKGMQPTANTLKRLIRAVWDEQSIAMSLEALAYYVACFGNGLFKITYDKYADYGEGGIIVLPIDPRLIRVDPAVVKAYNLDDAQYIIEDSVVPLAWVRQRYPKTSKEIQPDTVTQLSGNDQHKLGWANRVLSKFFNKPDQGRESAIPRVYLREYWIADPQVGKDGELKYPGGRRLLRTGDGHILNMDAEGEGQYGQKNPFFDGLWPYEMFDNEPDPDHPWGHAEVTALKKLNEAFNRVGHSLVKQLIKNVPLIITDANALRPEDITDLKELEEIVLEKAAGRTVERIPPSAPTAVTLDLMRMAMSLVEMETGLQDGAMQGKGRVELRSQPQLEGLMQMSQVLVRSQARRLEAFLERVGQKLVSRSFQFCTDDRLYTYVDGDTVKEFDFNKEELRGEIIKQAKSALEQNDDAEYKARIEQGVDPKKAFVPTKFTEDHILEAIKGAWRLFRFKIIPFSSLASTRIQRAMMLEQLAEKTMIPTSMVLEEAGFDNPQELTQQAVKEMQERQAMGVPPPQPNPAKDKNKGRK